jgi:hypothetical protein
MPARYVSFVVRVFVPDDEQNIWGRVYCVPDQEGQYFRDWDRLVGLMQAYIHSQSDDQLTVLPEQGPS